MAKNGERQDDSDEDDDDKFILGTVDTTDCVDLDCDVKKQDKCQSPKFKKNIRLTENQLEKQQFKLATCFKLTQLKRSQAAYKSNAFVRGLFISFLEQSASFFLVSCCFYLFVSQR